MKGESAQADSLASQIQMQASRWVVDNRTSQDWTADDQAALDQWLNSSVAHKVAYLRAGQAWNRTSRATALRQPASERKPAGPVRKRPFLALQIAAAIGAVAVLGIVAVQNIGKSYTAYRTPVGGRQILSLSDGSQIELNTNSAIRIADRGVDREVIVDRGEVYFEVKHDSAHPFIVMAAGRQILDLGTKFLVRSKADRLEVALYEGRVRLGAPEGSRQPAANLVTGDLAVATANATKVSKGKLAVLSDKLSWRQGVLIFHHTALADAAAEFNRYNSHKIIVEDPAIGQLVINGKFRTNDVGMFADVAAEVLGLNIEKQSDQTLIER